MPHEQFLKDLKWFRLRAIFEPRNTLSTSAYSVLEAITKEITTITGMHRDIIFHIDGKPIKYRLKRKRQFNATLLFPVHTLEDVLLWRDVAVEYFQDPWNSRNISLIELSKPEIRQYSILENEIPLSDAAKHKQEICLDFLTPLAFKLTHPKKRAYITKLNFINLFLSRLQRLFNLNHSIDFDEERLSILFYWRYNELAVPSISQRGSLRYINGSVGKVYIRGDYEPLIPYLLLCSELHTGASISHGRGYFILTHDANVSYINSQPVAETLQFYVDKNHDRLAEKDSEALTQELYEAVLTGQYEPTPSEAFRLPENQILTERLFWKDQILHSFIYHLLKNPVDNILPLTVVGFRPHISQPDIKAMMEQAIEQGLTNFLTFTIDRFYSSVDHELLMKSLEDLIPCADHQILRIIQGFLKIGYIYEGKHYPLDKGLPKGSPLSPLLANIYLLPVDRALNASAADTIAIRHADTYLIMSISEETLRERLKQAKALLTALKLKIKEDSIRFSHLSEGITFAGVSINENVKKDILRKPVYITKDNAYISTSSDTMKISISDEDDQIIPLNRVNEIIITSSTTLSTPFIRKCLKLDIPITISSQFNSPVAIIKKDNRSFYDSIIEHTQKYKGLSDEAVLLLSKDIASLKLKTYEMLINLKRHLFYGKAIIDRLKYHRQKIAESSTIDSVRGYEAIASKEIYRALNDLIKNPFFHIKTRQRTQPDPMNSLINLSSHLTFNRIKTIVCSEGLNPYLGFLHSPENRYESLVADIQELYRARMDSFLINLVNLKIIDPDDFSEKNGSYKLKSSAIQKFISHFEEYLNKPCAPQGMSVYDTIYKQISNIKAWIRQDKELIFEIPW